MADRAEIKQDRVEFLTALATYMQSAQAVAKIPEARPAMPMLLELLKMGLASFPGSDEMEGIIDQTIAQIQNSPPQQQPDPAVIKAQMDLQKQQQKFQQDIQKELVKAKADMQKLQADLQKTLIELQAKTQAKVQEEAAQAAFNIQEKKAEARLRSVGSSD